MDPTYPLFPIFAFLGFLLPLIPLPWHLLAWNSGTCYFMIWASLSCLNQFVNSIVWHGNAFNSAPIWCDISIRIMMGASVGIPASALCISRRLYHIANIEAATVLPSDKRRAIFFDTLICVVFPLLFIPLQYIVQGHRFNIYEDIGCFPALYNTIPTYFIFLMWPIVIGLITAVYCILTLRAFLRRRADFSRFLSSNRTLTVGRYFRLMALAMTAMFFTTALATAVIVLSATTTPVSPWISWEDTHFNYGAITQLPALIWRRNTLLVASQELTRWMAVFSSLVFFAFFGLSEEARIHYRKGIKRVRKGCGMKPDESNKRFVAHLPSKPIELPPYSPSSEATYVDNKVLRTPTQGSEVDTLHEDVSDTHHKVDSSIFDSCSAIERNDRRFTL